MDKQFCQANYSPITFALQSTNFSIENKTDLLTRTRVSEPFSTDSLQSNGKTLNQS